MSSRDAVHDPAASCLASRNCCNCKRVHRCLQVNSRGIPGAKPTKALTPRGLIWIIARLRAWISARGSRPEGHTFRAEDEMPSRLMRLFVLCLFLLSLASTGFAARRSSLGGNLLIKDTDDVFFYPHRVAEYNRLVTFDLGTDNSSGSGGIVKQPRPSSREARPSRTTSRLRCC